MFPPRSRERATMFQSKREKRRRCSKRCRCYRCVESQKRRCPRDVRARFLKTGSLARTVEKRAIAGRRAAPREKSRARSPRVPRTRRGAHPPDALVAGAATREHPTRRARLPAARRRCRRSLQLAAIDRVRVFARCEKNTLTRNRFVRSPFFFTFPEPTPRAGAGDRQAAGHRRFAARGEPRPARAAGCPRRADPERRAPEGGAPGKRLRKGVGGGEGPGARTSRSQSCGSACSARGRFRGSFRATFTTPRSRSNPRGSRRSASARRSSSSRSSRCRARRLACRSTSATSSGAKARRRWCSRSTRRFWRRRTCSPRSGHQGPAHRSSGTRSRARSRGHRRRRRDGAAQHGGELTPRFCAPSSGEGGTRTPCTATSRLSRWTKRATSSASRSTARSIYRERLARRDPSARRAATAHERRTARRRTPTRRATPAGRSGPRRPRPGARARRSTSRSRRTAGGGPGDAAPRRKSRKSLRSRSGSRSGSKAARGSRGSRSSRLALSRGSSRASRSGTSIARPRRGGWRRGAATSRRWR